ncbi:alpha/beta fold hydrolase [Dokdonella sp.]|uniref:alpha/beta fold hydrolase n=1 Tax=Dokdonella sp. TaxID=2291710 RepID=UPI0035275D2A
MTRAGGKELRIPLRHLELAAKAWGDPADPPMLAVHGWLDNAGSFDHLAPLLKGHYVVAIDLGGHGRSAHRPPGTWYPYADFLDEIGEAMDQLGWQEADLLGHSLGATLVSVFAAICPQRVRRLLLIEGLGPLASAADQSLHNLRRSHLARMAFKPDKLRVFNGLDEAIEARRKVSELSPEAARCIVSRGVREVSAGVVIDGAEKGGALDSSKSADRSPGAEWRRPSAVEESSDTDSRLEEAQAFQLLSWSSDPALTLPSPTRLTEEQLASILPAISAPTLLLLAEPAAPYLKREVMEARIALLADIEVLRLAGSHHLHLETPEMVAAPIREFLKAHPVDPARDTKAVS